MTTIEGTISYHGFRVIDWDERQLTNSSYLISYSIKQISTKSSLDNLVIDLNHFWRVISKRSKTTLNGERIHSISVRVESSSFHHEESVQSHHYGRNQDMRRKKRQGFLVRYYKVIAALIVLLIFIYFR